jgi:Uma2 family endonuclease
MVAHGLLTKYDKIELLDGLMVEKLPRGNPHLVSARLLVDALLSVGFVGCHIRSTAAIALSDGPAGRHSAPEPDVSWVRGGVRDYRDRTPTPNDVVLIAEVADSTLRNDRARLARYAWSKIPVVWLVNLIDGCVEVYTEPTGPADPARYDAVTVYGPDDHIPVWIDGREVGRIAVKDILP